MTSREIWEALLVELGKVGAPSMLLADFNYFLNKAINIYINKRYNLYDTNLQTADDLRVLKATAVLDVEKSTDKDPLKSLSDITSLFDATYEVTLPTDYLHLLNCICIFEINSTRNCDTAGKYTQFAAKRLTADIWPIVMNDYYSRPTPERPYYYIHHVNKSDTIPTNVYDSDDDTGTDMNGDYDVTQDSDGNVSGNTNLKRKIILNTGAYISTVDKETAHRYGNPSNIRMEIRCGDDSSKYTLVKVLVDYLKTPQYIKLTLGLINLIADTSQIMEFPDYVCHEIINELVLLVLNNISDPRSATTYSVSQSIVSPVQQLTIKTS